MGPGQPGCFGRLDCEGYEGGLLDPKFMRPTKTLREAIEDFKKEQLRPGYNYPPDKGILKEL